MTKAELSKAVEIATNDESLSGEDITLFDGFATKIFKPITCTTRQLAALVRWQCCYMSGEGIDQEGLNQIAEIGKNKFTVV